MRVRETVRLSNRGARKTRPVDSRADNRALGWARIEIVRSRGLRQMIGVAVFAMATAFAAKVMIPVPGTPVPFTFQVVCVILAGALLGPRLGAASQITYVAVGALGAPVFAAGGGLAYLVGPTGGYLLAFPLAAYVVGSIAGRRRGGALPLGVGLAAGVLTIHAGGAAWLAILTGDAALAVGYGVGPFLLLDVVKIGLALLVALRVRPRALELF